MARLEAADLARRLAARAETVCRHYLPNGCRKGGYWLVGDIRNTPGRSLYVRLTGPDGGKGAAGKWTDAATGEHGDLLDLIQQALGLYDFTDVLEEARRFLGILDLEPPHGHRTPSPWGSKDSARRLFAASQPIVGTLAETYLRRRGITMLHGTDDLRFHPRCYHRADRDALPETWPALIAAVTGNDGVLTGVHRTWLARDGSGKAPIATPRRAMGDLLGHAVRFGRATDVMATGEGLETMLSLRCVLPAMPMAAALSSAHLAGFHFPPTLRRLYIARDDDPAGHRATAALTHRAQAAGIEAMALSPRQGDFNDDLRRLGMDALRAAVRTQLAPRTSGRSCSTPPELTWWPIRCDGPLPSRRWPVLPFAPERTAPTAF